MFLNRFISVFMLKAYCLGLIVTLATVQSAVAQPNVVIVMADQWRGSALGYLGKEKVYTPYLDSLARHSATISKFITNYPVCSPSRAIMLTGQYPFQNQVYGNVNSATAPFGVELPKEIACWSDRLKSAGYYNGYIGKWHLDSPHKPFINTSNNVGKTAWNEWTPPDRRHGFDYWYAYGTYDVHTKPMYWDKNASREGFHYVDQWGPEHEVDKAISFFENKNGERMADKPFSLMISMNPPHTGYEYFPKQYLDPYQNIPLDSLITDPDIPGAESKMGQAYRRDVKNYYANITGVDAQIGRMMQALEAQGLLENTIVIITADHGNCLGKHEEITKNNIFEPSLEIPFIVYWKNKVKPGINDQVMASMIDFYPTLLDLCGLEQPRDQKIKGNSFAKQLLSGSGAVGGEQFFMGRVLPDKKQVSGFRGVRTARYKLAYDKTGKGLVASFFDLQKDPFELNNLYQPGLPEVKLLERQLKNWLVQSDDAFYKLLPVNP